MGWHMGKYERLEAPKEFNQLLKDIFGVDEYGDALYRIIWGQTETTPVSKPGGGYQETTMGGGLACWILQRKTHPAKWGGPALFRIINRDPVNGQLLFPYPEYGQYELIMNLGRKPLDYEIIHATVPFLEALSRLSDLQLGAWKERMKAAKEKEEVEMISDRLMDSLPTRYGPVSYGRGGCRTSVLDQQMYKIQQVWNQYSKEQIARLPRGMKQGRTG